MCKTLTIILDPGGGIGGRGADDWFVRAGCMADCDKAEPITI